MEAPAPTTPTQGHLAAIGIHVESRTRVIEESAQEATIPLSGIAKLLAWPDHDELRLFDSDGNPIGGPVTLRGTSMTER